MVSLMTEVGPPQMVSLQNAIAFWETHQDTEVFNNGT